MLDWRSMAQPVAGGRDTEGVLRLAAARGYRRPAPGVPAFLDAAVTLEHVYAGESWTPPVADAPAALTPAVATADVLLGLAPVLREQTKQLVHAIHPAKVRARTTLVVDGASRSHSLEHRFGTLWSTIDCPFGFAQSIVHEMAHQKLRALGLPVEGSGILIANPVSELYPSPILPRDRPAQDDVLHDPGLGAGAVEQGVEKILGGTVGAANTPATG
jgi:HEXXH motif-containing protein